MAKYEKIKKCPYCGTQNKITATSEVGFNGMLEDLEGFSVASYKCKNCGFEDISKISNENIDLEKLVDKFEKELDNGLKKDIDPTLVGMMLLNKLRRIKNNLTIDDIKSIIRRI